MLTNTVRGDSLARPRHGAPPSNQPHLPLTHNQVVGATVGGVVALALLAMRNPSGAHAYRTALLDYVPFTAGIGALYTAGACVTEELRGQRDWRSSFVGGAAAGAFSIGLKRGSAHAAVTGALGMGVAAACGDWFAAMEPPAAFSEARLLDRTAIGASMPVNDAATASASSRLIARLQ